MGEPAVTVGVVDIGTNSMRLLITDGEHETGRWVEVTGLGAGVDATGELSSGAMDRTLDVLAGFGRRMDRHSVERRLAIATSASRDASNREEFFDRVESILGVRPKVLTGEAEGRLAFVGAGAAFDLEGPVVVSDIGGGSTELVTEEEALSVDIGTVRLTDRALPRRPPSTAEIQRARELTASLLSEVGVGEVGAHVGVAGTWTSVAAISLDLDRYEPERVHGSRLSLESVTEIVSRLSRLTLDQTREIPSLDPKRAPVILPGALIAVCVMSALSVDETLISERDTLDGAAMELIGIP